MGFTNKELCFAPYKVVKDVRTSTEISDASSVLDGNIDPFLNLT